MNEELYLLFNEINPESRNALDHVFKGAPKMLRLVAFLKTAKQNFKTPKAIHLVYQEELEEVAYPKLINRYYKLRQQLIEWLYHYLKKTENFSSKEEQSLNFIRYLVNKNQFKDALDKAIKLEKHCRKLNLFELLPRVINLIIYCRQCLFLGGDKALIEDEKRLLEAIELHQVLQKLQYYHQQSYRDKTIESYQSTLKAVRKSIAAYKNFPRFTLIYHYIAFSKGCTVFGNVKKSTNALVRHLNKIETILMEHPQMPIIFATADYVKVTRHRLWLIRAMFYFQRGQFVQAANALKQRDIIERSNPNVPYATSEAEIRNIIGILLGSKQYDRALKQWEELVAFYIKHEQEERLDFALMEKANIYFFQYPRGNRKNIEKLLEELKQAKGDTQVASIIDIAMIWLRLLLGKAMELEEWQACKAMFQAYNLDLGVLIQLSNEIANKNQKRLVEIIQELVHLSKVQKNSIQELYYQQFIVIAKTHIK